MGLTVWRLNSGIVSFVLRSFSLSAGDTFLSLTEKSDDLYEGFRVPWNKDNA